MSSQELEGEIVVKEKKTKKVKSKKKPPSQPTNLEDANLEDEEARLRRKLLMKKTGGTGRLVTVEAGETEIKEPAEESGEAGGSKKKRKHSPILPPAPPPPTTQPTEDPAPVVIDIVSEPEQPAKRAVKLDEMEDEEGLSIRPPQITTEHHKHKKHHSRHKRSRDREEKERRSTSRHAHEGSRKREEEKKVEEGWAKWKKSLDKSDDRPRDIGRYRDRDEKERERREGSEKASGSTRHVVLPRSDRGRDTGGRRPEHQRTRRPPPPPDSGRERSPLKPQRREVDETTRKADKSQPLIRDRKDVGASATEKDTAKKTESDVISKVSYGPGKPPSDEKVEKKSEEVPPVDKTPTQDEVDDEKKASPSSSSDSSGSSSSGTESGELSGSDAEDKEKKKKKKGYSKFDTSSEGDRDSSDEETEEKMENNGNNVEISDEGSAAHEEEGEEVMDTTVESVEESAEESLVEEEEEEKDLLPIYFPGISGCRSVEEFHCLNRIEEGTYGVVYRATEKRTGMEDATGNEEGVGLVLTNGDIWTEQRRFAMSAMKDLTVRKPIYEKRILVEAEVLGEEITLLNGTPFDAFELIRPAVLNMFCSTITGHRFQYREPLFQELLFRLKFGAQKTYMAAPNFMPLLVKLPLFSTRFAYYMERLSELFVLAQRMIGRRSSRDAQKRQKNLVTYVETFRRYQSAKTGKYFSERQLLFSVVDLLSSATDPVSETLGWGIIFMAAYPQTQELIIAEMEASIESESLLRLKDRPKLPYLEATLMEVQRLADIMPLGMPRRVTRGIRIDRYYYPQGAWIVPLLSSVLKNDEIFEEPGKFEPARFFDDDGHLRSVEEFVPFSLGKRSCLGESVAKSGMFLLFGTLIRNFRFAFPDEDARKWSETPFLNEETGDLEAELSDFKVLATKR